ncbi:MAG: type toxin-antitoxin system RelE/ParE family toxin [Verrucomicrobia bacterium]|nr:type toxin-antitoxin system RelE/ParE family toxin [Verrucomicrobiota bacterium]
MEFVRLPLFEKSVTFFSEDDIFDLELALLLNPSAGALIPGGRGLRKLRRPLRGRGKRGGARIIYYLATADHRILLLYAYAKNTTADLTAEQLKLLIRTACQELP